MRVLEAGETGEKPKGTRWRSIRLSRRLERVRWPFIPFGLIPVAGLGLLFVFAWVPFAFASVERDAEAAARTALAGVGAVWATASASGQWIHIGGTPPSQAEADRAVDAVRRARKTVLFGAARPVTRVTTRFVFAGPETPVQPPAATPPAAQPETPAAIPPEATPPPAPPSCDQTLADLLSRSRIEFTTASAVVGDQSSALLDQLATAIGDCSGRLRIEGHTDNVGRDAYNISLGHRRAEAVRTALVARGVPADRLVAQGFGADEPVADNATEEGRARNRRIEIRTIPPP